MNNMKKAYPCHLELRGLSANAACALCGHEAREHRWYPHRKTQEDAILRDALREASRDVQIMRDARKNAADVLALRAQVEELRAQLHAVEQKTPPSRRTRYRHAPCCDSYSARYSSPTTDRPRRCSGSKRFGATQRALMARMARGTGRHGTTCSAGSCAKSCCNGRTAPQEYSGDRRRGAGDRIVLVGNYTRTGPHADLYFDSSIRKLSYFDLGDS